MGRFYKATPGQFIENKMFQLDPQVMMQATKSVDENINKVYDKMEEQKELLKTERLGEDDPAVRERLAQYEEAMTGIASSMSEDITGYKRYGGDMRDLSRKISSDLNTGLLGTAQKQKEVYDKWEKELVANKAIGQDRKDLLKRAVKKRYGSLDYQEDGTFNAIEESLITGLEDIKDLDYINTIQQGWEADQDASAWYTDTSSGTRKIKYRNEREVEEFVKADLDSSGWRAQKKQMLELQDELGELPEGETVESMMKNAETKLIQKAKSKIGYKQESVTAGGGRGTGRGKNTTDPTGNIEVRSVLPDRETKTKIRAKRAEINKLNADKILNGDFKYYESAALGLTPKVSFKQAYQELKDKGVVSSEAEYRSMVNTSSADNVELTNLNKDMVSLYNNRDLNEDTKAIYIMDSKTGKKEPLKYNSVAEMLGDTQGEYVYLTPNMVKSMDFRRDSEGYLVDKNYERLSNVKGGPIKDIKDYDAGTSEDKTPIKDKGEVPTYSGGKNPIQTTHGNLKMMDYPILESNNNIRKYKSIVDTQQMYRMNTTTKELEYITTEIEIDPERLRTE